MGPALPWRPLAAQFRRKVWSVPAERRPGMYGWEMLLHGTSSASCPTWNELAIELCKHLARSVMAIEQEEPVPAGHIILVNFSNLVRESSQSTCRTSATDPLTL